MIPEDQLATFLSMPTPMLEQELLKWRSDLESGRFWSETSEDLEYIREAEQIMDAIEAELGRRGSVTVVSFGAIADAQWAAMVFMLQHWRP
jgi:hypothetical protein